MATQFQQCCLLTLGKPFKQENSNSIKTEEEDFHEDWKPPPHDQKESSNVEMMIESLSNVKQNPEEDQRILDSWLETFFRATFDFYQSSLETIELKHRKELGDLVKETMHDMNVYLLGLGDGFDDYVGFRALCVRSGFQFMIDNFKDFPVSTGGTLKKSFEYFKERDTMEALDESLAIFKKSPYFFDGSLTYTSDMLIRPDNVPVSHYWWFGD